MLTRRAEKEDIVSLRDIQIFLYYCRQILIHSIKLPFSLVCSFLLGEWQEKSTAAVEKALESAQSEICRLKKEYESKGLITRFFI